MCRARSKWARGASRSPGLNKKLLLMMMSGVALTIAAATFAVFAIAQEAVPPEGELNASLNTGLASLDEGPLPKDTTSSSYDLSSHQTLSRVILLIRENYVEPERINSYEMFLAALDYIQKTVPEVLVDDSQA